MQGGRPVAIRSGMKPRCAHLLSYAERIMEKLGQGEQNLTFGPLKVKKAMKHKVGPVTRYAERWVKADATQIEIFAVRFRQQERSSCTDTTSPCCTVPASKAKFATPTDCVCSFLIAFRSCVHARPQDNPAGGAQKPLRTIGMDKIKGMLVDTLKVHEYDVFALRPLDIRAFNDLYETICGLSILCNGGATGKQASMQLHGVSGMGSPSPRMDMAPPAHGAWSH